MDDRARAILDEARETLHRVRNVRVEHRDHPGEYWSRPKPEPEPAPVHRTTDAETARWEAHIDDRISAAINQHVEISREIMAQALASERKRHRAEVEKLDLRLSALLAEVTERQTIDTAAIIDLPMLPRSQRRA